MKNKFWLRKALMVLLFVPLALFAFGSIVMLLWNAILPAVIHVTPINFWQALGILILSKILFGGFKGGGGRWGDRRRHMWKDQMEKKLSNMSVEEKEKFKQDWKNRCSRWGRSERADFWDSKSTEPTRSSND
jgi:hypothetical protein